MSGFSNCVTYVRSSHLSKSIRSFFQYVFTFGCPDYLLLLFYLFPCNFRDVYLSSIDQIFRPSLIFYRYSDIKGDQQAGMSIRNLLPRQLQFSLK